MSETAGPLSVTRTAEGIEVVGEIDASTVSALADHLEGPVTADVVIEMSGVQFIDSSGLRVLIEAHQRCDAAGHRLIIRSPSATVRRLFEISGLTGSLNVELTELT